ncbi:hypothetical protein HY029_02855 [Candidatus Gottesmanbacteria bacterium]|nr:hypothetical protein [Candidatus Gottesmanbacteria bacterium]
MNHLFKDALKLAKTINSTTLTIREWTIINIAKLGSGLVTFKDEQDLPTVYGYTYEDVIDLFEKEGVIEEKVKNYWYLIISKKTSNELYPLTLKARKLRYITPNEFVECWKRGTIEFYYGPEIAGKYSVLINKNKLSNFIKVYSGLSPRFDLNTGEFTFLGEKVKFNGDIEIKSLSLLLNNLNCIISKKEFYEIRGNNYDAVIKSKKETATHDMLEKVFREIKRKIYSNEKLKNTIIFVQEEGFGLFINLRAISSTPQIDH